MFEDRMSQKCSICGEREAVIFVKIVSEEGVEEKGLCATCAAKYLENKEDIKELNLVDERLIQVIEEMKDLLAGIVANISAISVIMNQKSESSLNCSYCGTSFQDFKDSGRMGCPYCYNSFKNYIQEFVFEMERGSNHRGKMPAKFARLYVLKKEIKYLNNKLRRFLDCEEYEEAEKIRKKLEKLIGNYDSRRQDEID